jgi:diacylglycerol kinase (ATP)
MEPEINKPEHGMLMHIFHAFGYSMAGMKAAIKYEESFRIELILAVVLFPVGLWLGESSIERVLFIVPLLLVLITELLNSAMETTVDRVSTEQHPLSGRAKDIGSAACFLSQAMAVIVWAILLLD